MLQLSLQHELEVERRCWRRIAEGGGREEQTFLSLPVPSDSACTTNHAVRSWLWRLIVLIVLQQHKNLKLVLPRKGVVADTSVEHQLH